jgi:DHA2 family multidrug resistance protein
MATSPSTLRAIPPDPFPPRTLHVASPVSYVEFGARRVLVVAGVMLAALLQTVDATIVNVALPTIQGNLGASLDDATWVVTAYVIANVVVIPLTPWLQSRFGRKAYFLASIVGFTIASMLCGLATSLDMLIFFRVIQGVFGGGLLPMAQIVLRETFPKEELGTSQSIFALGAVLGPSIGPTLGGVITDNLSWQWVFDINLVPGIVATILLAMYLRGNAPSASRVDFVGVGLLIAAIASMQYVLDQGQHEDWFSSNSICIATAICIAGIAAFAWWELRTPNPIVDLRVLGRVPVMAACAVVIAIASQIYAGLLLLPQFGIDVMGYTATLVGLLIGVRALPVALLSTTIGKFANAARIDLRIMIGGGLALASLGTIFLSHAIVSTTSFAALATALPVIGLGIAFVFTPTLVATLRAVPPQDGPKASAFITLFTQLGGSVAAASIVAFVERRADFHQSVLAATATSDRLGVSTFLQTHSISELSRLIVTQAATLAYADAFLALGVLGLVMSPVVIFLTARKQSA